MFYFIRIAASAAKYVYIIVGDNDVVVEKTPRTFFLHTTQQRHNVNSNNSSNKKTWNNRSKQIYVLEGTKSRREQKK